MPSGVVREDERVGVPESAGGFGMELAVDEREGVCEWEERSGKGDVGGRGTGDEV